MDRLGCGLLLLGTRSVNESTTTGGSEPAGTADFQGRRERGIAAYARILAVPAEQVLTTFGGRVGPVFTEEALQGAGGAAWSHPAFTARDRSVAIIIALTVQGISGDRLDTHLQLGRKHGLDENSLTALMTLLAGYIGYPRASQAMETVHALCAATDPGTRSGSVDAAGTVESGLGGQ